MRTGVWLFPDAPTPRLVEAVAAAEAGGLGELWMGDEGPARDPFSVLAAAAPRTERIRLGVGVTNPYLRHPALTASTAVTVHEASGGRFVLGLGPGGGLSLDPVGLRPRDHLTACRRALEIIRAVFEGRAVDGYTPPPHAVRAPEVPVYVGARGERFNRWASQAADGVFLAGLAPMLVPEVAGWARSVRPVELAVYVSADLDPAGLDESARPRMIHAFSNGPDRLLAAAGITRAEATAAADALGAHDPEPAARLLTDDRVELVLARGPEQLRGHLTRLARTLGPASVGVALVGGDPIEAVERVVHALAPLELP